MSNYQKKKNLCIIFLKRSQQISKGSVHNLCTGRFQKIKLTSPCVICTLFILANCTKLEILYHLGFSQPLFSPCPFVYCNKPFMFDDNFPMYLKKCWDR